MRWSRLQSCISILRCACAFPEQNPWKMYNILILSIINQRQFLQRSTFTCWGWYPYIKQHTFTLRGVSHRWSKSRCSFVSKRGKTKASLEPMQLRISARVQLHNAARILVDELSCDLPHHSLHFTRLNMWSPCSVDRLAPPVTDQKRVLCCTLANKNSRYLFSFRN